ncbi:DUF1566 domain-containing protein [Chromatium okenii]|uniref:Lcl C-terminal domain-containing protein n=1 Tax=Chromatium okenii TaxID=61644 RepID=UPI001902EB17|nr:DUF1566 domain-containing protein [Chromatium okenii]
MPKIIKFDLPIDGIRAKNIDELREHFTLEILPYFHNGLLAKWLAVRKLTTELSALQAIAASTDPAIFKDLCAVFGVEADDVVIALMFNDPTPKLGLTVAEVVKQTESADKVIHLAALLPIQAGTLKLFTERTLVVDAVDLDGTDLILQSADGTLIFKSCRIAKAINARYLAFGDGTVLDIRTSLQWMRCALGQTWDGKNCTGAASKYNWNAAHEAVAALNHDGGYAGYCDWWLPSLDELKTLVYCSSGQPKTWNDTGEPCEGECNRPMIDSTAFPDTPSSWFWSGSPHAGNSYGAWFVNFFSGNANYNFRDYGGPVRLVRGGQ